MVSEDKFREVWKLVNGAKKKIRTRYDRYNDRDRRDGPGYTDEDIGRDAVRALKKIAMGAPPDPTAQISSFAGMPSNFRQSCLAPLDGDDRYTASSVLSGVNDPNMGDVLHMHRGEGKVRSEAFAERAGEHLKLTTNKQRKSVGHPLVFIISLREARGIPAPESEELRKAIRSRRVRVCLMRGRAALSAAAGEGKTAQAGSGTDDDDSYDYGASTPRGWAERQKNHHAFIGNQHIVPASWNENYEDEWLMSKKTTQSGNKKFLVRVNADLIKEGQEDDMCLLVELTCTVKRKTGMQEMSCGWCSIPLRDLDNEQARKDMTVNLRGGSMADAARIKSKEVLQRRTGIRAVAKFFQGRSQPTISLRTISANKLDRFEKDALAMLPPTMICSLAALPLVRAYRLLFVHGAAMQEKAPAVVSSRDRNRRSYGDRYDDDYDDRGRRGRGRRDGRRNDRRDHYGGRRDDREDPALRGAKSHGAVNDPALCIFPYVLDHPDLFRALLLKTKDLRATFRKSSAKALDLFRDAVLTFWPAFCDHRVISSGALSQQVVNQSQLTRMRHDSVANIAGDIVNLAAPGAADAVAKMGTNPFPAYAVNAEGKKERILYTPFHISEVIKDPPARAHALSQYEHYYE